MDTPDKKLSTPVIPPNPEALGPQSLEESLGNAALGGFEEGTMPTELRGKDSGAPTAEQIEEFKGEVSDDQSHAIAVAGVTGMDLSSVSRASDEALSGVDIRKPPTEEEIREARAYATKTAHLGIDERQRLAREREHEGYGGN